MKTRYHLFLVLTLLLSIELRAQVKIGTNPNTIDPNSLIELESNNKGFLGPRVTLVSLSLATPLTSPVPTGMLVYNTGGSIKDGFYYWSGSKWLLIQSSINSRDNYVLVKSASDFPAPVAGIITLASNTLYEINGTIALTNKININDAWLKGGDALEDKLVYVAASGELFTGSSGGNVRTLTLSAPTPGSKVFNLDAGGVNTNFLIENCYIGGSDNIGNVKNYGGTVFFQTIGFINNTNGITFENDSNLVIFNTLWDKNNHNIYEKFVGNFSAVQKTTGAMLVNASNTATGIDVSGVTSIRTGEIKNVLFTGDGTYKNGTFNNNWEIDADGIDIEKDAVATGNLYISTTATTVIAVVNTPYKILGTTTPVNLFRTTSPTSNRLNYTGRKTRKFQVICSLTSTYTGSGSNKFFSFYIAKNGVVLPESKQKVKLVSNTDQGPLSLSCNVQLAPNDYVEVWVENNTDATDMIIYSMNLSIK